LGTIPSGTADDVVEAVRRARAAQPAWAARPVKERVKVLRRFHDLIFERQAEVLDLIQLESGKVRAHAFEEVADVAIVAAYYARVGHKHLRPKRRRGALPVLTTTREVRHPKGVAGFIAPWNYPLSMAVTDAIPALVAGNGAVLKPAQTTSFTAMWIADLLYEAGLPDDLLQLVTGRGSVIGTPMVENVDFVTFTGSTEVGRGIARQAGENLIGCALELGGKNAMLVLEDANIARAVHGAIRGSFSSAGQLCISKERLYVHRSKIDEFTRRFVAAVDKLTLSADLTFEGDMGSLQSRDQLETVVRHVEDAVAKGATVLTGGVARPDVGPLFYAPTVLTGTTKEMAVSFEETFGPVVAIYPFDDLEEGIARANDSTYGLNASVWTRDAREGVRIASRIQAGTVNVNDAYAAAWASVDAPMGGVKDSGLGRRHGREGIWKYTEVQTISRQRVMAVGAIPGLSPRATARALTVGLKVLHKVNDPRL
jgi:succinate-semialdehyde dehydrogenase/glutarate-semialdehyde dehydrogenase